MFLNIYFNSGSAKLVFKVGAFYTTLRLCTTMMFISLTRPVTPVMITPCNRIIFYTIISTFRHCSIFYNRFCDFSIFLDCHFKLLFSELRSICIRYRFDLHSSIFLFKCYQTISINCCDAFI